MDKTLKCLTDAHIKNSSDKKLLGGILKVPYQNPPIENIIYAKINTEILDIMPVDLSIIIMGKVGVEIEYSADVPSKSQPVHYCHFDIHYNHLICIEKYYSLSNKFSYKDITEILKYKKLYKINLKEIYYSILLEFKLSNRIIGK